MRATLAGLLITLLATGAARAEGLGFYAGARLLAAFSDSPSDLRSAYGGGLNLGYEFPYRFALEGEVTTTVSDGRVDPGGLDGDWEVQTVGAFAVWRSPGKAYGKIRLGWLQRDLDVRPDPRAESGTSDEAAASLGFGLALGRRMRMEWEATRIDDDLYAVSYALMF